MMLSKLIDILQKIHQHSPDTVVGVYERPGTEYGYVENHVNYFSPSTIEFINAKYFDEKGELREGKILTIK